MSEKFYEVTFTTRIGLPAWELIGSVSSILGENGIYVDSVIVEGKK